MTKLPIGITRIGKGAETTDYVTCIPMERVFAGGLPSEAIVGILLRPLAEGERVQPDNFAANSAFVDFMQGVVSRRGPWVSDLIAKAKRLGNGTLVVSDRRARVPETELSEQDIFGEFDVNDGRIVPESYRPNSRHYLYSADGFFQLGAELEDCLVQALAAIPDSGDQLQSGDTQNLVN